MFGRGKQGGHYAVRRSVRQPGMWKIVIAYTDGSEYDDIDLDLFATFERANQHANDMNKAKTGSL